jgi:hypothetical protein
MRSNEKRLVAQCITCGSELHPERAKKYNYCMAPDCQEKNLKGLPMVAVGVNKSAEQYLLLDDQTRDELAAGKFRDQRRGLFGTSVPSAAPVDQVPGETRAPLQRAGKAPRRNSAETRPDPVHRHPDHPHLKKPRKALTPHSHMIVDIYPR